MNRITRATVALAALTAVTAPTLAAAQPYGYDSSEYRQGYNSRGYDNNGYDRRVSARDARANRNDYDSRCRDDRRSSGNKGAVAGAVVGGASGALIGGDLLGGLVGAGVGAVAGHQIAKGRTRC